MPGKWRGTPESDNISKWIAGVDDAIAAEIGRLILTFAQLEHAVVGMISARLGRHQGFPLGFSKAALIAADNTFSQNVQLFRALGGDLRLDEDELKGDKKFATAALEASSARNSIVHAWFRGSGQPEDSFYMYWKKKSSAEGGASIEIGQFNVDSIREIRKVVEVAFNSLVILSDYKRFRSYQGDS